VHRQIEPDFHTTRMHGDFRRAAKGFSGSFVTWRWYPHGVSAPCRPRSPRHSRTQPLSPVREKPAINADTRPTGRDEVTRKRNIPSSRRGGGDVPRRVQAPADALGRAPRALHLGDGNGDGDGEGRGRGRTGTRDRIEKRERKTSFYVNRCASGISGNSRASMSRFLLCV